MNRVIIVAVVIFFFGIFYVLFNLLFSVPQQVYDVLGIEDLKIMEKISSVLREFAVIVIAEFILGAALVVWLLNQRNKNNESVVYVEKYLDSQKTKSADSEAETGNGSQEAVTARIKAHADAFQSSDEKKKALFDALCKELKVCVGAFFVVKSDEKNGRFIELQHSYAYVIPDSATIRYEFGEGISGQAAKSGKLINLQNLPPGYVSVFSGLGEAAPKTMAAVPVLAGSQVIAVIELARFEEFSQKDLDITQEVCNLIADVSA